MWRELWLFENDYEKLIEYLKRIHALNFRNVNRPLIALTKSEINTSISQSPKSKESEGFNLLKIFLI